MTRIKLRSIIASLQPADQELAVTSEASNTDHKNSETTFDEPFISPKPVHHSPKISPSSIPNPSPSVITNKQIDPGYPKYGGYFYSVPGYSAFQPVSYPGVVQPSQAPLATSTFENTAFTSKTTVEEPKTDEKIDTVKPSEEVNEAPITASEVKVVESKMSITSLSQGSGATVTIPVQNPVTDIKKKPERFSLKTSIPISKIDIKCVSNQPDIFQKKPTVFNPAFAKTESTSKIEIQSNIIIKPPTKELDIKESNPIAHTNSINTLLNAAEEVSKNDNPFRMPETKIENNEPMEGVPTVKSIFNPVNVDNKVSFPNNSGEPTTTYPEQKNQIVFIKNKNSSPKMLLTIQQQNPQVLLQRTNFESKNLQAPSRLSSQSKKNKDDDNSTSKVVALKRCHQENCDENDFENLITENQIYGNKIVVKEKSQGTQQEQDLKNKKVEKPVPNETKNVVLQPNFLYLSNVKFPTNLMMIKNNTKVNNETNNISENKSNEVSTNTVESNQLVKPKAHASEIHVIKPNNNVIQTVPAKGKTDLVIQTNQKVIMNPHIVYQVPMLLNSDKNQDRSISVTKDYPKLMGPNKETPKQFEQKNEKLFIACPYQVDSKLQPKIVITNIRPKIAKVDEFSSLDLYEKRRRMRRLKYLSNKDSKEVKNETKKQQDSHKNIITPDKMKLEIYKEFANTKLKVCEASSDSDSDYDNDMKLYDSIIKEYDPLKDSEKGKLKFLECLKLATHKVYKEKQLEIQERIIKADSVATAFIAAGRLDRLLNDAITCQTQIHTVPTERKSESCDNLKKENATTKRKKREFLSQLRLKSVSQQHKEGFERIWQEILKERKRRDGIIDKEESPKQKKINIDTMNQLKMLTEIKKSVNDNNNLIKKRLDSSSNNENEESIKVLAEKNFSELNRLSKMAGRSVKIFSGKEMKKRDLNPGFDSENIQKNTTTNTDNTGNNYLDINIPKMSKIISLKTVQSSVVLTTSQATSMDEPKSSAAGAEKHEDVNTTVDNLKSVGCQVEESYWQGIESITANYREYEAARKKEIADLHRRNTVLRVECATVTRCASRESDRARALLAERRNLALEEKKLTLSIHRICNAIKIIKES